MEVTAIFGWTQDEMVEYILESQDKDVSYSCDNYSATAEYYKERFREELNEYLSRNGLMASYITSQNKFYMWLTDVDCIFEGWNSLILSKYSLKAIHKRYKKLRKNKANAILPKTEPRLHILATT